MDTQVDGITWDQSDQSSARGTGIVCGALGFVTGFWNLSWSLGLFYWDWGDWGNGNCLRRAWLCHGILHLLLSF